MRSRYRLEMQQGRSSSGSANDAVELSNKMQNFNSSLGRINDVGEVTDGVTQRPEVEPVVPTAGGLSFCEAGTAQSRMPQSSVLFL